MGPRYHPGMADTTRWRSISETVHLTALGLWLGSLVMTGVTAALMFPMMKKLDPVLAAYPAYTGDHWMLAAGQIAARVFLWCDAIQFTCMMLCLITLAIILKKCGLSLRRRSSGLRVLGLLIAVVALGAHQLYLAPRMQLNMRGLWESAQAGNNVEAVKFKELFDKDHPLATRLMGATTVGLLLAMVAGAWSATTSGLPDPPASTPRGGSQYEEPRLRRRRAG